MIFHFKKWPDNFDGRLYTGTKNKKKAQHNRTQKNYKKKSNCKVLSAKTLGELFPACYRNFLPTVQSQTSFRRHYYHVRTQHMWVRFE